MYANCFDRIECTPYDTLENPSFNRYFDDWIIDPALIPAQANSNDTENARQILGIIPLGFEDGQVYYPGDVVNPNFDNSVLRAGYFYPLPDPSTGVSRVALSQYIDVCPGVEYHFEAGLLMQSDTGLEANDCAINLSLGPDNAQGAIYDWATQITADVTRTRYTSNNYTPTSHAAKVRIAFLCQSTAFVTGKNPLIYFDAVRLYTGSDTSGTLQQSGNTGK